MSKKISVILVCLLILMVICIIICVIMKVKNQIDENVEIGQKYENKGQVAMLLYNEELITNNNVKVYNEDIEVFRGETYIINVTYAHVPLIEILEKIGASVNWKTKNIAKITFQNTDYILNLNKKTFIKKGENINMITPVPGCETFYCYTTEKNIVLDGDTLISILKQMEFDCYLNIDIANSVIRIGGKTGDGGLSWYVFCEDGGRWSVLTKKTGDGSVSD